MSVTCDRSVDLSGYCNFRHKSSNWNIFESGVKHLTFNGQMMDQTFVYVVHNIKHLSVIMWELFVGMCPKNIYSFWIKLFVLILEVASIDHYTRYFRIPVVITISVSRKKIYNQYLGTYDNKLFGWSGVYFISILHLYITVTCRHTIVFYGKDFFSNIKMSSKRLEYLNIFPSFFKKFNTSWNQKKYFNSICVLFILIIW